LRENEEYNLDFIIKFCKENSCFTFNDFLKISKLKVKDVKSIFDLNNICSWSLFRVKYLDGKSKSSPLKGKNRGEEFSKAVSEANRKKAQYHLREETKLKISMSCKNKKKTKEHAINISKGQKGLKRSDEAKEKMRISALKRIAKYNKWHSVNNNESKFLDEQEIKDNCKILRQYQVGKCMVDGYCQETNTVYEVYENYHNKQIEHDLERQKYIEEKLNCRFIIIQDATH